MSSARGTASWWRLEWLSPDGRKLLVTRILHTFGYGYLAVVLAIYLEQLGLSSFEIGLVLTSAIVGSAVMTVFWSLVADRYGRRKTVSTMAWNTATAEDRKTGR
jgi:MFS family permease